jgi:hypothetical protein
MAVYKVAQDVEADDKLIGPFSFRQFVYLIIVALSIAIAWGLGRIFVGLAIIPMPIIIFFGALALPLRKDQPMEIYMAAIVSFYLKPRRRLWVPDGIESLVEITAPKVVEVHRTKDISQTEAERRLGYLADIADTQGWAVRHAAMPTSGNSMVTDAFFAAQQTEDVLDESGGLASSIDSLMSQADARRKQDMLNRMRNPAPVAQPVVAAVVDPMAAQPVPQTNAMSDPMAAQYTTSFSSPVAQLPTAEDIAALQYNPYPTEIHQMVINPIVPAGALVAPAPAQAPVPTPSPAPATQATESEMINTSETTVSPDIINLANNSDLSIETISREAARIQKKADEDADEEVFISLH